MFFKTKKNTLLDHLSMNLIPYSRYACTVLSREKIPFLRQFLDEPDTPFDILVNPGRKAHFKI